MARSAEAFSKAEAARNGWYGFWDAMGAYFERRRTLNTRLRRLPHSRYERWFVSGWRTHEHPVTVVLGQLVSKGSAAFFGESRALSNGRSYSVPWISDDIHEGIRNMHLRS